MITVAILTISDSTARGTREDLSGPALRKHCEDLGWKVLISDTVSDDEDSISERLSGWSDESVAALILTTGGTGVSPLDVTPEATRKILDREIPGVGELMRAKGLEQTRFAPLSRALAGSRKRSLIVNLPGSPAGAVYSLQSIQDLVPHLVDLLAGRTAHDSK